VEEGEPQEVFAQPRSEIARPVQETADELRVKLGKRGKAGVMQNLYRAKAIAGFLAARSEMW